MMDKVRDYGEVTLALMGVIAGAVWFVFKKIVEYIQLKHDIKGIQEKLDILIAKQSSIFIDIELIKHDISLRDRKKARVKKTEDEEEDR